MRLTFSIFFLAFATLAYGLEFRHPQGFQFDFNDTRWETVVQTDAAKAANQDVDREMAQRTLATIQTKTADEKYRSRFSVVTDSLKPFKADPNPLQAYQKHAVDFLKSQRFTITSTQEKKLPNLNLPGVEIIAYQRDFGLTFKQVIFIKDDSAYLLTGAARTNKFEEYDKEIQAMLDSFKFVSVK